MIENWLLTGAKLIHGYGVEYRATRDDDLERWFREAMRRDGRTVTGSPNGTLTAEKQKSKIMLIGGAVHVLELHPVDESEQVMDSFIDHVQGIGEWRMLKFAVHGPIINVQYELDVAGNETLMFRFSTRHGDLARRAGWLRQRGLELKAERWKGRGPWAPAIWEEDDGNTFVIMTLDHPNEAVPPERCRSGDPDRAAAEQPL